MNTKMRNVWELSGCSGTRTRNFLVLKRALNHLVKLANTTNMCKTLNDPYITYMDMILVSIVLLLFLNP